MNYNIFSVCCSSLESEVSDSDEEIYGGEISVWNRSWAKEINHMYVSVCERSFSRSLPGDSKFNTHLKIIKLHEYIFIS